MLTEPLSFYDVIAAAVFGAGIVALVYARAYAPRDPEDFDE